MLMKLFVGMFLVLIADIGASAESNVMKDRSTKAQVEMTKLEKVKKNHKFIMEALENKTSIEMKNQVENLAER